MIYVLIILTHFYHFSNTEWKLSLPYGCVSRSLRRWMRNGCPAVPKHIVDVGEVLGNDVWKERMTYYVEEKPKQILVESVIDEDDLCHVIFYSPDFVAKVLEIDMSSATVDGTFRTVPWLKGASQILIISVFSFGKVYIYFFIFF